MAVNGQNITPLDRSKYISQKLEALNLARRRKMCREPENAATEKGDMGDNYEPDGCKFASTKVCYVQSDPSPEEENKPSLSVSKQSSPFIFEQPPLSVSQQSSPCDAQTLPPCVSQKLSPSIFQHAITFTPPFRFVRPSSLYTWTRGQTSSPAESSISPKINATSPSLEALNWNNRAVNTTPVSTTPSDRSTVSTMKSKNSNLFAALSKMTRNKELASHTADSSLAQGRRPRSQPVSPNTPGSSTSPNSARDQLFTQTESDNDLDLKPKHCFCNRPLQLILCKSCGNVHTGRIRKKCHCHPNQLFLMDMLSCAECESPNLKEISSARPLDKM